METGAIIIFMNNKDAAEQSVHLTGGYAQRSCAWAGRCSLEAHSPNLRHFRALSTLEQNPALEVLSTPAHPQVTQTVGLPKGYSHV